MSYLIEASSNGGGGGGGGEEVLPTYTVVYGSVTVPDPENPQIIELAEKTLVIVNKEVTDLAFFSMWFKAITSFASSFGALFGIVESFTEDTSIEAPCVRVRSTQFQGFRVYGDPTSDSSIQEVNVASAATTHASGETFSAANTEGVVEMFVSPTRSNVTDVRHHCRHAGGDGEQRDTAASNGTGQFTQTYGPGEGNTVKAFARTESGRTAQIDLSKIVMIGYGDD